MTGLLILPKMWRWSVLPVCLLLLLSHADAQTTTSAPETETKTFVYEVVSIHPAKQSNGMSWRTADDGFSTSGASVRSLLLNAFGLITSDQIVGLPAWGENEQFDLEAKMDSDTSDALKKLPRKEKEERYHQMLQAMLADRFHLKFHRDTKEIPVYALVVAKNGAKLKESAPDTPNNFSMNFGSKDCSLHGQAMELSNLAFSLSSSARRIVLDKTGLTGKYDMDLKWSQQDNASPDDSGPSLFTALQEQLGLKLEPTKAPVESIVIEHVDRPTEN
jgi:uncharacterized protein (TIGR03435 family)